MPRLRAGLIGAHISRTRLPSALQILCDHAGWELDFALIDTANRPDFDFAARLQRAQFEGWTGMTVTHPWKTHARAWAGDDMHTKVTHLGASNTLIFDPRTGFNTDYTGFLSAFSNFDRPAGKVVMMGAGGVAEALAPALIELGATDLTICDVAEPRAQKLAKSCGARVVSSDDAVNAVTDADGLVNATPLGMAEYPGTAFDPAWMSSQSWAFDAVYTPTNTAFLRDAAAAGLACLSGFDLFRAMAVRSFEAYTGLVVDDPAVVTQLNSLKPE